MRWKIRHEEILDENCGYLREPTAKNIGGIYSDNELKCVYHIDIWNLQRYNKNPLWIVLITVQSERGPAPLFISELQF